jgi:hypothetical protein
MSSDEDVFAEALELPPPEQEVFLDRVCADNPAQRARVAALLAGVSVGERLRPVARTALPPPGREKKPGDRIRGYKLLEKIGVGGAASFGWLSRTNRSAARWLSRCSSWAWIPGT